MKHLLRGLGAALLLALSSTMTMAGGWEGWKGDPLNASAGASAGGYAGAAMYGSYDRYTYAGVDTAVSSAVSTKPPHAKAVGEYGVYAGGSIVGTNEVYGAMEFGGFAAAEAQVGKYGADAVASSYGAGEVGGYASGKHTSVSGWLDGSGSGYAAAADSGRHSGSSSAANANASGGFSGHASGGSHAAAAGGASVHSSASSSNGY